MRGVIYIILFLISYQGVAQIFADKEYYLIDSLVLDDLSKEDNDIIKNALQLYHKAKDDTSRINALNGICEGLTHEDWVKYQFFQYNLIEIALAEDVSKTEKESLLRALSGALNNIGLTHYFQGEYNQALKFYNKSLKIKEELKDTNGISTTFNNMGMAFHNQGNIPLALEFYHKSLTIKEKLNDKSGMSDSYNNIGMIHKNQGDELLALEYYQKSLSLREELKDKKGMANSYNNIGFIYQNKGDISTALQFYNKSLKLREFIKDKKEMANSYNNIGFVYLMQKNLGLALEFYNKSLQLRTELNDKKGLTISYANIGKLHLENRKFDEAKMNGLKSLNLAKEIGYPNGIKSAAKLLSAVYAKQGDGMKALEMYKLSILMRDSVNNEETLKATVQQSAKYEYEKQKAVDDAEHDKRLVLEQEKKEKQQILTGAITVGLGLVIVFLIFVFNRLQVTKKQKLVIEGQRDIVEEAHKEIRDSINYAERIQRSFLATDELLDNNLKDYFVFFQPKDVVSGDFYWAGKLSNNQFAVVNADSTGHGVPGAIMSILNISSIEKAVENGFFKPSEIFNHTRDTIIDRLSKDGSDGGGKDGMDASIISFDFENNKFSYTAAQNPIWILRKRHCEERSNLTNNGYELIEIKPEKMPIGKHDNDATPFVGGEFETQKGDVVYSLTDGFQDQFGGEKGKKFKVKPFKNLLISIAHLPMQEQKEILNSKFTAWKGEEEQVDDVCVIGVRI